MADTIGPTTHAPGEWVIRGGRPTLVSYSCHAWLTVEADPTRRWHSGGE
jgi:hypothetical protein